MARRKRRLGHITKAENNKVRSALVAATGECWKIKGKSAVRVCRRGVALVGVELSKRGFNVW